jgi:heme/copper-type cytochrome/quinol oxidase subunit 3
MTLVLEPRPATTAEPSVGEGRSTAWWGMMLLIITEAMIFAGLLSSYFFIRAASPEWPPHGIEPPKLERIALFSVVLLASSFPVIWAEHAIAKGNIRKLRIGLAVSFVMGAIFLVNQGFEYKELAFGWRDNAYGSLFYMITGLHGSHVLGGLLMNLVVQIKAWTGRFSAERHRTVQVFGMYWHFVDVVWIFVFTSLYLSAHW